MKRKEKQFSTRFWEPYDGLVMRQAEQAGIKPNQLVRVATMSFVDHQLLDVNERLTRIESSLVQLISEFSEEAE